MRLSAQTNSKWIANEWTMHEWTTDEQTTDKWTTKVTFSDLSLVSQQKTCSDGFDCVPLSEQFHAK